MDTNRALIRRLTVADADLLRLAYEWDRGRAQWYVEMDRVFNSGSVDDLLAKLSDVNHAFIGVFDPALTAIVIIQHHEQGQFEGHLMARRGANLQLIKSVISYLLYDLLNLGLSEAFVWVAEKHRSVRKLCANIQFQPDGLVMYKGAYRRRVIKWIRYSIQREQILMAQAA